MFKSITITLGIIFTLAQLSWAATVVLEWDPNTEPDLLGYRLYQSAVSGQYTKGNYIAEIIPGTKVTYTVEDLSTGTYFWVLTAFDQDNNESDFSNEVSTEIADPEPLGKPGKPGLVSQ